MNLLSFSRIVLKRFVQQPLELETVGRIHFMNIRTYYITRYIILKATIKEISDPRDYRIIDYKPLTGNKYKGRFTCGNQRAQSFALTLRVLTVQYSTEQYSTVQYSTGKKH